MIIGIETRWIVYTGDGAIAICIRGFANFKMTDFVREGDVVRVCRPGHARMFRRGAVHRMKIVWNVGARCAVHPDGEPVAGVHEQVFAWIRRESGKRRLNGIGWRLGLPILGNERKVDVLDSGEFGAG